MERILLKPAEAADAIGLSRSKVYTLIRDGVIPSIRVGGSTRVPLAALNDWVRSRLRNGQGEPATR